MGHLGKLVIIEDIINRDVAKEIERDNVLQSPKNRTGTSIEYSNSMLDHDDGGSSSELDE